jgi:membrane associated rhomboid family serine protease
VDEWALVLAAEGIPYRLADTGAGFTLLVAAADAGRAAGVIAAYEAENRPHAARAAPAAGEATYWLGVGVALLLLGFFAVTGPRADRSAWFEHGSASAEHIISGEVWRTVTALTLHADVAHVLANGTVALVLVSAVAHLLGPGLGLCVLLLAGAAGNWLTALAQEVRYVSVGASTLTFGAIGILAAQRLSSRWQPGPGARKPWVAIVASLLLLSLLGTSEDADVPAHGFGLLSGAVLGVGAGLGLRRRPGRTAQWALGALALVTVVGCWLLARYQT